MFPIVWIVALFSLCSGRIYFPKGWKGTKDVHQCEYSVDIAQVLDVSYSQFDNMATMKATLVDTVNWFKTTHPESRFSLNIFTDKPIPPLGYNRPTWTDFCLKSRTTFDDTEEYLESRLMKLQAGGGFDFPEAQLEALMRAGVSPMFHWRTTGLTPGGRYYVPSVLMVTDSIPHFPPAALNAATVWNANPENVPVPVPGPNELLADPTIVASDLNSQCGTMEYPAPDQIATAFKSKNILPVFLLAPAAYTCGDKLCVYPELKELAKQTGNSDYLDPMKGMILVYEDLLDQMNMIGVIQELGLGFEGFREKFEAAIEDIGLIPSTCVSNSTPAPSTTSTVTTTTTTTTTATTTTAIDTTTTTTTTTTATTTSTTTTFLHRTTTTTTTTSPDPSTSASGTASNAVPPCDCCEDCPDSEACIAVNVAVNVTVDGRPQTIHGQKEVPREELEALLSQ